MNLLAFTSSKDAAKGEEWSPISLLLHNLKMYYKKKSFVFYYEMP